MEFENKAGRTELSALGEFGLIEHLTQSIEHQQASTLKGIGDDAAVVDFGSERKAVISTDMLVEGIHFDLSYVPLKHLGYKAVVVNLSDIYAMNAKPQQVLVSIALSNRFSLEAVEELYAGIYLACDKYKVDLIGGDTTSNKNGLVISVTVLGEGTTDKITYRSGAKVNDLLCVSGDLGGAFMGLQLLEREKRLFQENPKIQPDLEGNDYILERQLKPEARKDIPLILDSLGIQPTAMIDVSDGLASEVLHLCKQSAVGCNLYEEKIPIDPQTFDRAREFNLDPTTCALSGGEDYELLFTVPMSAFEKLKDNMDISIIGHITTASAGNNLVTRSGTVHPLTAQGWDALLKEN